MGLEITELLELPNIYVESYSKTDKGWLLQLRPLSDGMRCPGCGRFIDRVHQAPKVIIRDLAILKRPVHLQIPRRQFHCPDCQRYATEQLEFVDWRRRHTRRFEQDVYERVQHSSLEQIAREEGISPEEVRGIFEHVAAQSKKRLGRSGTHKHR
ncbi:helix-turn-helix domain-containing protein [Gloeobacter morelensis]|uniref:Transposase family protein n=1 Tax=Gloeobacter morelensis MG652769 TaxID=2781736 RepID=A0ABY3PHS9_9CYAN|nr:helix-turn-helix domain-containing protein [Gloeobacter morelensis]UFP93108.1 transposase family protein [Gloeobacter morelensis MG652769]